MFDTNPVIRIKFIDQVPDIPDEVRGHCYIGGEGWSYKLVGKESLQFLMPQPYELWTNQEIELIWGLRKLGRIIRDE